MPEGVLAAIGSTPVVRLTRLVELGMAAVWVKMEAANPTGSYKDRMALAMIEEAERAGRLAPGQAVVEYTGGSTGSSRRTHESRRFWRVDDRWHTTYWISRWPQLNRPGGSGGRIAAPDLVNLLTGLPALASTFSLTATRSAGGAVAVVGHVRVTARSESDVAQVGRLLESRAQSAGTGLVRLDMEQTPGMLATLPLGGTR